jgi:hypothetical protein
VVVRRDDSCLIDRAKGPGSIESSVFRLPTFGILRPGQSETVAVQPPANGPPWQVQFAFDGLVESRIESWRNHVRVILRKLKLSGRSPGRPSGTNPVTVLSHQVCPTVRSPIIEE